MTLSQQEYQNIIDDNTKIILEDILWETVPHTSGQRFRAEIQSDYPLSMSGWYNPASYKLSFALIHQNAGRIYGLDLGADHRNPDGVRVGEKHKNYWREGDRDKWAYVPQDITEPWDRPLEVWRQFCDEAKLRHLGIMRPPTTQMETLL